MKHCFTTFCFLILAVALNAQTSNPTTTTTIPQDFPKYVDTGNPVLDAETYNNAKTEWIKNHQAEYKAMNQTPNPSSDVNTNTNPQLSPEDEKKPVLITKEVFENSSAEKQKYILEHPTEYTIVE